MEKKRLATVNILVKNRQKNSLEINKVLAENGHLIIARLGVNLQKNCIDNCPAIVVVVVEGKIEKIEELKKILDQTGAIIKINFFKE